jgi:hypothetical protein
MFFIFINSNLSTSEVIVYIIRQILSQILANGKDGNDRPPEKVNTSVIAVETGAVDFQYHIDHILATWVGDFQINSYDDNKNNNIRN